MKLLTFAGLVAGFFLLKFTAKKTPLVSSPIGPRTNDFDSRYDIDDFITDQEL